jgi:hypothetical protein
MNDEKWGDISRVKNGPVRETKGIPTMLYYGEGWADRIKGNRYRMTAGINWRQGWSDADKMIRALESIRLPIEIRYEASEEITYISRRSDLDMSRPFVIVSSSASL